MHINRLIAVLVLSTAGCNAIKPTQTPPPTFYALDRAVAPPRTIPAGPSLLKAPTLIVDLPLASSGFDSPRMAYIREAHKLEYFANNGWIDPPARLLTPLLADAIEKRGTFRAVVMAPSAAAADFRLSTELVRLQHEFTSQPSRVRFTLRVILVEDETRKVVASREFEAVAPASSETPYGGVLAANIAVQTVLAQLATFCEEAARVAWVER